ncbi:MAG: Anaphase-promoting complex, cyclosome, subunit 3, partial [Nitrososphaeraceae archaeon]|nr:Anaphase-promoting complex, cyclosome, subunit 3 [Nitrososphaeraceae archaeon]
MNHQQEKHNSFFQALISCIDSEEYHNELKNDYPEDEILSDYDNKKYMELSKKMSKQWILELLRHSNNIDSNKFKNKKNYILELQDYFNSQFSKISNSEINYRRESEIEIYGYFLYLSGILYLIKDEIEQLENLKRFFEKQIQNVEDSNLQLFLKFLKIYTDIINPKVKDIIVFKQLKDCIIESEYHDDILFKIIKIEHNMMLEIVKSINGNEEIKARIKIIKEKVFPKVERKYIGKDGISIIESLMLSGLARLYFIAGKHQEYEKGIYDSLAKFPNNSFALLQQAQLLSNQKYNEEEDLSKAEKKFYKVIRLIEDENQFKDIDSFNYRIKLEAVIGLAYIDYLKGLGNDANKKYQEADEIIENKIKTDPSNKAYLKSSLLVNRGRNKLDNLNYKVKPREKNGKDEKENEKNDNKDEFNQVIKIYHNAEKKLKDELAEIAIIAYNNLAIYYLNEGLYEEAEEQFKNALHIDNVNPHTKYNLGVLYYKKGETDRALTLIRNARKLDPKFKEAKQALDKLDAEKRSLGMEWFDWWFKTKDPKKKSTPKDKLKLIKHVNHWNIHDILKRVIIFFLFAIIIVSIGKLA